MWRNRGAPLALRLAILAFASVSISAGSAAAEDLSVFNPASQAASSIRDLFYLVLGITGAIFVLVEGVLLYAMIRFRRRAVPAGHKADEPEPAQVYGSAPLEVAWTVAPLLIVFVLFLVVVRSVYEVQAGDDAADPAARIQLIGHQWWWEIRYPGEELDSTMLTANELHVPIGDDGQPVRIEVELLSADVIHSFWVPRLAGKTDMIPGRTNHTWFTVSEPATYYGQCAEFCGTQHANMKLRVIAESRQDFDRWQQNERLPAAEVAAVAAGREKFLALACINCHTVRGTPARGTFGPDLTHFMTRHTLAAGAVDNNHENLRAWIADPDTIKPGSLMPNMHLSPRDVDLIVSYLETLR